MNKELIERLARQVALEVDPDARYLPYDSAVIEYATRFLAAVDAERGAEAVAWIDSEQPSRVTTTPYKPEENDSGWLPLFLAPQLQVPEGMVLVPRKLTDDGQFAMAKYISGGDLYAAYKAMIAATEVQK